MGTIFVIGIGPGPEEFLTPAAQIAIEKSEVLVGGKETLKKFRCREKMPVGSDIDAVIEYIRSNKDKCVGVLTSGDSVFYSLLGRILNEFSKEDIEIVPGISSVQLFFSRIKETMNDATFVSVHGRTLDELKNVIGSKKLVILTDSNLTAKIVAEYLLQFWDKNSSTYVGENLGRDSERLTDGSLEEISNKNFSGNAVMVAFKKERNKGWDYVTPGIPDKSFIRKNAPMTKEEVRVITLSKLRIKEDSVIYDIGAGTGSISIEAGIIARSGMVYAIEKVKSRSELIDENLSKFNLRNVKIIHGEAPDALIDLPVADRIVIGGNGGKLTEILKKCDKKLSKEGLIVMNFIALDSLNQALSVIGNLGFEYEVTQLVINKSKVLGGQLVIVPKTSVFVIFARRKTN
jgi:precorrin-6Y C5,15-methyltransferase (decarboxylating)|tara:strand:+ start:1737 stop:2945 length:1209 start_codon:yes stop_codon:yes gene_type:complete